LDTTLPASPPAPRTHLGLEQRVLARLKALRLPPATRIVVGFSGGPDSLSLAAVLARVAPVARVQVSLVHVDHGLRPESAADARTCADLASQLGLPLTVARLPHNVVGRHPGVGVEEAARRERYVALARQAQTEGAQLVAIAHHRQDQAETVLLHLLRGAGLSGAAGMGELTDLTVPWWGSASAGEAKRVTIWRPLLDESFEIVRGYALARGLKPVEDATNQDPRFRRNRLRHEVLPLLHAIDPGTIEALGRYARIARGEDAFLAELAAGARERVMQGGSGLTIAPLLEEPLAIRRRVLIDWLDRLGVPHGFALERIEGILSAAERNRSGCKVEIGGGWSVVIRAGVLSAIPPTHQIQTGEMTSTEMEEAH
jgi:tRNA(Ile)-lysidine synthetase-like protein